MYIICIQGVSSITGTLLPDPWLTYLLIEMNSTKKTSFLASQSGIEWMRPVCLCVISFSKGDIPKCNSLGIPSVCHLSSAFSPEILALTIYLAADLYY